MTQNQKDISLHVDTLADQTLLQILQHQNREKLRQEEQTNQKDTQAIAILQTLLSTEIEHDLLTVLSLSYAVHRDSYGSPHTQATFRYAGVDWHLSQVYPNRTPDTWQWSIRATHPGYSYNSQISDLTNNAPPLALQRALLLKLGERRLQLQRLEQEAAENERKQLQARTDADGVQKQKERERVERIAAADGEHAKWQAQIDTLKQQELERLWRWPTGVQIALYRITYTTGIGQSDDDEVVLEQKNEWTATDRLDSEGYIRIEPVRSYWNETQFREIKLDPSTHMPIWERIIVGNTNELPKELCEEITVSIPNVYFRSDGALDETRRLVYDEESNYFDENTYSERVGLRPVAWVRVLVEQQTQRANEREANVSSN